MAMGWSFGRQRLPVGGSWVVDARAAVMRRRRTVRRVAGLTVLLVGLPALSFSLTVGTAAAWGAGTVANYTGTGISDPYGIAAGPDGALWFTNIGNDSIGRISTTGTVTNYTGTGINFPRGIAAGPDGALWFTNTYSIGRISITGTVTNYPGIGVAYWGIAAGPDGGLWFTNGDSVGRISTAGTVTHYTHVGMDTFSGAITAGPDGALWFCIVRGHGIGRITTAGAFSRPFATDYYSYPNGIAAGSDGAVWFTTSGVFGDSIGQINAAGKLTYYTDPSMSGLGGIAAGPDGALWFTNHTNNSIGRITTTVTPGIVGFTPTSGRVGTRVTITGENLGRATKVAFNGTPAKAILSDTATQIVTVVPRGATTGLISVTTRAGTATSTTTFTQVRHRRE
jgi:virginiamycin B lyase